MAISKAMQNYCGASKCDALLLEGKRLLKEYEEIIVPQLSCVNPHELMRTHEVLDILTVSQLVIEACLARRTSVKALNFERTDAHSDAPQQHIVISQQDGMIHTREVDLDYYGDLKENYEKHNADDRGESNGI